MFELASALTDQAGLGKLQSITPVIGQGQVNQVFIVETDQSKVVLRLNDITEYDRFIKEQWCADITASEGVPGASVLKVGRHDNHAYTFVEYIEGSNGKSIQPTTQLWGKLGAQLRLIHNVETDGFGEQLSDITNGRQQQWNDYLAYNISSLTDTDKLVEIGVLDTGSSKSLKTVFEKLASTEFVFGLNHGDYSLANVIVDKGSQPHIIDWGSAQAHVVPHHDLGVILDEGLHERSEEFAALLSGYGMNRDQFNVIRSDIRALQLLEAVDKLRWALDKSPDRIDHHKNKLAELLRVREVSDM